MKILSNLDAIDKVNTIDPTDMPGGVGRPYPPSPPEKPPPITAPFYTMEEPPVICSTSTTAGENTVKLCNPDYDFPPVTKCRLHRPFLPMQLRDPGNWMKDDEPPKDMRDAKKVDIKGPSTWGMGQINQSLGKDVQVRNHDAPDVPYNLLLTVVLIIVICLYILKK